jgi:cellulose synthase/poly-beta-1,6-N-acetylglucosamine synthase-like glycosyltransferase
MGTEFIEGTSQAQAPSAGVGWSQTLDAERDLQHWSYKVPGLVVWLLVLGTAAAYVVDPALGLAVVRLLGLYLLCRILLTTAFYPVALWKIYRLQRRLRAATAAGAIPDHVHHVVIITSYQEPPAVLERTLECLAGQYRAAESVSVVLALEEREPDGAAKGQRLMAAFDGRFANFLVTRHPGGLPDEIPGKASNERWAAQVARQVLVEERGLPLERMTVTSCDADALLHPLYFAEVSRLFVQDPDRFAHFWHAPFLFDNNIWHVAGPVRLLTIFNNVLHLSDLANPFVASTPRSVYTLSFRLAQEMGYWDPMVIAEDSHSLLRAYFATGGRSRIVPVFLPTTGDAITGVGYFDALKNYYRQHVRHGWGCQDTGYILQQWQNQPAPPFGSTLAYFLQTLQDNSIYATVGLILSVAWVGQILQTGHIFWSLLDLAPQTLLFILLGVVGMCSSSLSWLAEYARSRRMARGWRSALMLRDLAAWLLLPVLTMALAAMPIVHANTKLLFGSPLGYWPTPKQAVPTADNGND